MLDGLVDPGTPILSYLRANGREIDPTAVDSSTLTRCTAVVRVALAVRPDPEASAITASTDVQLRNHVPEVGAC